ncbi:hypothetical protein BDW75DRAFT_93736 [Aspergillus navahoensis]
MRDLTLSGRRSLLPNIACFWQRNPLSSVSFLPYRRFQFYQQLNPLLYSSNCPLPTQDDLTDVVRFGAIKDIPRQNYITNVDQFEPRMQDAHDGFVESIRRLKADPIVCARHKGYRFIRWWNLHAHLHCIASSATTHLNHLASWALFKRMRPSMSHIFCDESLSALNVKCLVLSDIMNDLPDPPAIAATKPIVGFPAKGILPTLLLLRGRPLARCRLRPSPWCRVTPCQRSIQSDRLRHLA